MSASKIVDLVSIFEEIEPEIHYTGPGNSDGFAPYHFGGGRRKKHSGVWREPVPRAPVKSATQDESPFIQPGKSIGP